MIQVHLIYGSRRYPVPVEPTATLAQLRVEAARHWHLPAYTVLLDYFDPLVGGWVAPPIFGRRVQLPNGVTVPRLVTVAGILRRLGPVRARANGALIATAPRTALELRVRYSQPLDDECTRPTLLARIRANCEGRGLGATGNHGACAAD